MRLNPHLSQVLEIYDPERLNAILLWLNAELKEMFTASDNQQTKVINLESAASTPLLLDDLVQFSILNEFGPDFSDKPVYPWLQQQVCQKVTHTAQ